MFYNSYTDIYIIFYILINYEYNVCIFIIVALFVILYIRPIMPLVLFNFSYFIKIFDPLILCILIFFKYFVRLLYFISLHITDFISYFF
jgi:hypothetical protein